MEKKASESLVVMTELVLPNDTNTFGNLMGGRLMYWMDIAAAMAAMKHCGAPVVTAKMPYSNTVIKVMKRITPL